MSHPCHYTLSLARALPLTPPSLATRRSTDGSAAPRETRARRRRGAPTKLRRDACLLPPRLARATRGFCACAGRPCRACLRCTKRARGAQGRDAARRKLKRFEFRPLVDLSRLAKINRVASSRRQDPKLPSAASLTLRRSRLLGVLSRFLKLRCLLAETTRAARQRAPQETHLAVAAGRAASHRPLQKLLEATPSFVSPEAHSR